MSKIINVAVIVMIILAIYWGVFTSLGEPPSKDETLYNDEHVDRMALIAVKLYIVITASIFSVAQFLSIMDRANPVVKTMSFADKYIYYISKVIHFLF